eukprot:CAMPEP_0118718886 /NCGR_PEP_ID=MMETSP0800-20121206/29078_1 /TAXON_ID=210618 ORGANISM="Striatella unipunctata, Strain CCMP2910" /NCGR_SAMPLE_ID=MMETSP0800 /ASSEMBLY_ACC=CAM_ASM_000638 /LENGTH=615 /DNA_ID=CAMNT_0006626013 /DNA_START=215 /DNA_END=2062 /DNA_ORIENTATION=+
MGFKNLLETYFLTALTDVGHGYVYLFTLFLAGLVAMIQKSGGFLGLTRALSVFAKTPRTGQLAAFLSGLLLFFDDYANCLVVGATMMPIVDSLGVSREKLAFIVDATAAPIASIAPISSWVGFEVGLIQDELDKIAALGEDLGDIGDSGMGVFLQSISFRYYPIFMLFLQLLLIVFARDFGSMLVAERKTQVYGRKDGGDGRSLLISKLASGNEPKPDTPPRVWNFFVPVVLLVFFIFYLLVKSGQVDGEDQDFLDIIQSSDSYVALLWGTMAAAIVTGLFYAPQYCFDMEIVPPPVSDWIARFTGREIGENIPRPIISLREEVDSFMFGMTKIFPALVVLTLAWGCGHVMQDLGTDRFFAAWILQGISAEMLPTLSFIISALIALSTGTSWGTMAILFPLITVPTFIKSNGDSDIFYGTIAGILAGSVAGDHASPISDTTVLSSLAAQCDLFSHVGTQAPYVAFACFWSIILGTLPVGQGTYSTAVAILLGLVACVAGVLVLGVPIISPTGRFGLLQELQMMLNADSPLHKLKKHTIRSYVVGGPVDPDDPQDLDDLDGKPPPPMGGVAGLMSSLVKSPDEQVSTAFPTKGDEVPETVTTPPAAEEEAIKAQTV